MITNKMRREVDREVRRKRRQLRKAEKASSRGAEDAVNREAEDVLSRGAEDVLSSKAERAVSRGERKGKRKPLFSENKVRISLRRHKDKAMFFLKNDEKMDELLAGFESKLKLVPRVGHRLADIPVMVAMLRSYVRREYTKVPLDTILLAVAAVLYVVNPLDVVPDVLAGLGYLDDATALGIVLNAIHSDVVDFKKWQVAHKQPAIETAEIATPDTAEPAEAEENEAVADDAESGSEA